MEGLALQRSVENHFAFILRGLSQEQRDALTYPFNEFVRNCAYNAEPCSAELEHEYCSFASKAMSTVAMIVRA